MMMGIFQRARFLIYLIIQSHIIIYKTHCSKSFDHFELEQGASPEKVDHYYQTLYNHLYFKDYGFAEMGEDCDLVSIVELEDHIYLAKKIIKAQDPDDKYHGGVRVQENLKIKLRTFFHRVKAYCDFRRFLSCDKKTRRCSCAHASFQVNNTFGNCEIPIGKRCAFSENQLNRMGLPMISSEPPIINCIGANSECVASFGAASKICKCKSGYKGPDCQKNAASNWRPLFPYWDDNRSSNYSLSKGRAILTKTQPEIVGIPGGGKPQYFLFPEQVKEALVKLMNERQMFEPEEREKEADSLYSKMESDADHEGMVIRDLYLRTAANVTYGEGCNPETHTLLDNPPVAKELGIWVDPKPGLIENWQLGLLNEKTPLCNFIQYLKCDETKKICVCKPGLVYYRGSCQVAIGQPCGSDYEGAFEFDPLRDRKRFSSPIPPPCVSGSRCEMAPLFFLKQCWCNSSDCGGDYDAKRNFPLPPPSLKSDVMSRFTLHLNDSCDPGVHSKLFNPKEDQILDNKKRVDSIQKLLGKTPPVQFCNIEKLLNCSDVTKSCECFGPLVEEGGECRVRNRESCMETFSHGIPLYPYGGSSMFQIEQVFQLNFLPACIEAADCSVIERKCVCKNENMYGDLCDDPKSAFASVLESRHVLNYGTDKEVNTEFFALNYYTHKAERQMSLRFGEKCDPETGEMLDRILDFYKTIGTSDENIAGSLTLYQYRKAAKWAKYLIRTGINDWFHYFPEFCNGTQGLHCHQLANKCQCRNGLIYEDHKCKLNAGEECEPNRRAFWIPECRNNSTCLPALYNFQYTCQCPDGWDGEDCLRNLENSTQSTNQSISTIGRERDVECISDKEGKCNMDDRFQDLFKMLNEIMDNRSINIDEPCPVKEDQFIDTLFPSLPQFSRLDYIQLAKGPAESYALLLPIFNDVGKKFCNRRKYFLCGNDGKCACGPKCQEKEQLVVCGQTPTGYLEPKLHKLRISICKLYKWSIAVGNRKMTIGQ